MHQRRCGTRALLLLALLAACGRDRAPPPGEGELRLRFEDRAEPAAFAREGLAERDAPDGAAGLWAAVRGLPRPERAEVVNPENRRKVVVALFAAPAAAPRSASPTPPPTPSGSRIRAPVRITALRSEPQIDTTKGRF